MSYVLGNRSVQRLKGVNVNLVKVVQRAIQISEIDFTVTEGVRSREQCMINFGKGRTSTQCLAAGIPASYAKPNEGRVTSLNNPFNSKHVTGRAVDLAPYVDGKIDWNNIDQFLLVSKAMKQAAKELNISITYGGDWKTFKDYPHYEIS